MSSLSPSGRPSLSPARQRIVSDIVETLMPHTPELGADERARIHADVAAFVTRQVEAIPAFLAWAYRIAITGFDALGCLRYGRRFVALDAERRRAYLDAWAGAPIGLMRDFVKLLRSCTLLAYFDHPDVHARLAAPRASSASPGASA